MFDFVRNVFALIGVIAVTIKVMENNAKENAEKAAAPVEKE